MIPHWFTEANQKWLEFLLKLAVAGGAVVAYIVGLKQYRKGQSWQKATFLSAIITEFETNPKILAVKCMLDWDVGKIEIPPDISFELRNEVFCKALRAPTDGEEVVFEFPQDEIRDALDVFFDFFEKIESYRSIGLLRFGDLQYFYYWFESLRSMRLWKDNECKIALDSYLHAYRFFGVERLLVEYCNEVPTPPPGFPKERRVRISQADAESRTTAQA
jgi:hypothetical protein